MLLRLEPSQMFARLMSSGTQGLKSDSLVKNIFLKKIKEYGLKLSEKGDFFLQDSPETQRLLEDQLQRLASKYRLESKEVVNELPVKKMEAARVESAVSALFERKTIDDSTKALFEEKQEYVRMRLKKKAEAETRNIHFQATQDFRNQFKK